ncbi:metallophosphoesterase family protein [Dyadobacter frigoris]|uniref:Calcineurin-like phosphoesterase domain-containing protein n=1 Tax=Dyadobacter frigoris TaxID=2576211 RepID=A0A4U6DDX5_9BACT|nr:metallophosphoesterase [Dyadobacter frigoris]TKT92664.1 hypothetical protein FDK13_07565 [Dyadobacter frigoris]
MNSSRVLRIIHISDFHIGDKNNANELLSLSHYEEFINSFVNQVRKVLKDEQVDFLFITGDLVDKGNRVGKLEENMEHATSITNYIKKTLNPKQISTCIGNHDLDQELTTINYTNSIRNYLNFSSKFSLENSIVLPGSTEYIKVEQIGDIYVATIDINFRSDQNDKKRLELNQVDYERAKILLASVPSNKPLIVCSHLPWVVFRGPELIAEENGWMDKHLWIAGLSIYDKDLYENRNDAWTLYLYGDAHHPKFLQEGKHFHVLTSTFGGGDFTSRRFNNSEYNKIIEGTIIELDGDKLNYTTIFYKTTSQTYNTNFGSNWTIEESKSYSLNSTSRSLLFYSPPGEQSYFKDYKTEKISDKVSLKIKEHIKEFNLYRFGRFPISNTHASLGWISIHKLFEQMEYGASENGSKLLQYCLYEAKEWITDPTNPVISDSELNDEETLFLGINLWGGIFASFLGMMCTVPSFSISMEKTNSDFVNNEDCSPFERLDHYKSSIVSKGKVKNIILFTDVVSTGETVLNLLLFINSLISFKPRVSVVSIISDCDTIRKGNFEAFHRIGTLCKDMKLPIIHIDTLPDEDILPSKFSIHS